MPSHTETDFEKAIEYGLTTQGGYEKGDPKAFDETLGLFPNAVVDFLLASQPTRWAQLETLLGTQTKSTVLDALSKELDLKGTLHVLRHGFRCYGKTMRMA